MFQDNGQPTGPTHVAYSWVVVKLTDANDNAPQFDSPHVSVRVAEDVPVGRLLSTLRATDTDRAGHGQVRYSVDRSLDRRRQFHVTQDGRLTVHRPLDKETASSHKVRDTIRNLKTINSLLQVCLITFYNACSEHLIPSCFGVMSSREYEVNFYLPT